MLTKADQEKLATSNCERDTERAMSQENVDVVRKLYESRGSEFFELLDPHVVFINYASAPETRPYIGHEGVREWAAGFRATFGDYETRVNEIIDAGGDQVVVDSRVVGVGTTSGVRSSATFARFSHSSMAGSSERKALKLAPKPWKPPGCGSRPRSAQSVAATQLGEGEAGY